MRQYEGWDTELILLIKNSLTLKIFLITCALLVMVSAVIYTAVVLFVPNSYSVILSEDLQRNSLNLSKALADYRLEDSGGLLTQFSAINQVSITILDKNGVPATLPGYVDSYAFAKANYKAENGVTSVLQATDGGNTTLSKRSAQIYPVIFKDSDIEYMMLVIGSVRIINEAATALYRIFPVIVLTVVLVSLLVSWLYSRYITRPILQISQNSEKMMHFDFQPENSIRRDDEIGKLSDNLNSLTKKLSEALEGLKSANLSLQEEIKLKQELENKRLAFFSAVSHDLKTPITVIRGQLEGMLLGVGVYRDHEKYLRRSLQVTDRMEALVSELMMLSHLESHDFTLDTEEFDFGALLCDCLKAHDEAFTGKNLDVNIQIDDGLYVKGNKNLLGKVISNLADNAGKYSPDGYRIFVEAYKVGAEMNFAVENTGVTIPEDALLQIFNAFYRVEQSRSRETGGSGLGLSIVKTILELHHAPYKIENTDNGVRFTFTLRLQEKTQ